MKSTILITSGLLASSYASSVKIQATQCTAPYDVAAYDIEINTSSPWVMGLHDICGLELLSTSDDTDINTIGCLACKDAECTRAETTRFDLAHPAMERTDSEAIYCYTKEDPSPLVHRQSTQIAYLETTKCIEPSPNTQSFGISIGPEPWQMDLDICGLRIVSADPVDVNQLKCRVCKNAECTRAESVEFDYKNPALLSTNPVHQKAVFCVIESVQLLATQCVDSNMPSYPFDVAFSQLVPADLHICGLKIVSVSAAVGDVNSVACRVCRDEQCTRAESVEFDFKNPALLSTNPVQEKAIFCDYKNVAAPTAATHARQTPAASFHSTLVTKIAAPSPK